MYGLTHRLTKRVFITGLLILLLSCGKDKTIINNIIVEEPKAFVVGEIGPKFHHHNVEVSITVANTFTIPEILVNDTPIDIYGYADLGIIFYENDYIIDEGDSIELVISYTKQDSAEGLARADLMYPGPFEFIGFNENVIDTVYVGEDLSINWTSSEGKERYIFKGFFSYLYRDSLGQSDGVNIFVDSIMFDTSMFIPATVLFPNEANIMEVVTGGGDFSVYAESGPVRPGDNSNIYGDGSGFIYTRNRTRLVTFEILD